MNTTIITIFSFIDSPGEVLLCQADNNRTDYSQTISVLLHECSGSIDFGASSKSSAILGGK